MTKIEELREQEEKLEIERENYLEADDNRGAKRIEKKLFRVRDLIKVEQESQDIEITRKIKIYKEFIDKQGLKEKFDEFYNKEIKKEIW